MLSEGFSFFIFELSSEKSSSLVLTFDIFDALLRRTSPDFSREGYELLSESCTLSSHFERIRV